MFSCVGLRSQAKRIYNTRATPSDDRRLRYSEKVTLENSSDEEDNIIRPSGEGTVHFIVVVQCSLASYSVMSPPLPTQ